MFIRLYSGNTTKVTILTTGENLFYRLFRNTDSSLSLLLTPLSAKVVFFFFLIYIFEITSQTIMISNQKKGKRGIGGHTIFVKECQRKWCRKCHTSVQALFIGKPELRRGYEIMLLSTESMFPLNSITMTEKKKLVENAHMSHLFVRRTLRLRLNSYSSFPQHLFCTPTIL